jgi:hypothetical protein
MATQFCRVDGDICTAAADAVLCSISSSSASRRSHARKIKDGGRESWTGLDVVEVVDYLVKGLPAAAAF